MIENKVAVIYRKIDGEIMRVATLTPDAQRTLKETDIKRVLPGMDVSNFNMVFLEGDTHLDIGQWRVETDHAGNFLKLVANEEVLVEPVSDADVIDSLLDRPASIVISILSIIDDKKRLNSYKELEERGQNRLEVINFFKQRGI